MKRHVWIIAAASLLAGCDGQALPQNDSTHQTLQVTFNRSVGQHRLAQSQIMDAVSADFPFQPEVKWWNSSHLEIRLEPQDDAQSIGERDARAVANALLHQFHPDVKETRVSLHIEITDDASNLEQYGYARGDTFDIPLDWDVFDTRVALHDEEHEVERSEYSPYPENPRVRDFYCAIETTPRAEMPRLAPSQAREDPSTQADDHSTDQGNNAFPEVPVAFEAHLEGIDDDWYRDIILTDEEILFVVGFMGRDTLPQYGSGRDWLGQPRLPPGVSEANCHNMIMNTTDTDLAGFLRSRAERNRSATHNIALVEVGHQEGQE